MKISKRTTAPKVVARNTSPAPVHMPGGLSKIQALAAKLNEDMDGLGYIGVGSDVRWLDPERIRTGILGLDVISSGGIPRRSMTQFWGPNSTAKTTTLLMILAACQRRGGSVCYAPSETFSKDWGRKVGCWIPYAPKEYEKIDDDTTITTEDKREIREAMARYDVGSPGLGHFMLLTHPFGDGLLEASYRVVTSNLVDIMAIDSLAACKPSKLIEENEVGDDERGSGKQIQMLIQWTMKINSAFSLRYDEKGNASPKPKDKQTILHNETAVIALNQAVQDQTPVMGPMRGAMGIRFKPSMGEKLKHAWNLSVEFKKGFLEEGQDEVTLDGAKKNERAGIEVKAYVDKSRVGVPYRAAHWHLYTREFENHQPGTVDKVREARVWGLFYGVIENQGAWYTLPGGRRLNGKDAVDRVLAEEPEMCAEIERIAIERARR